MNQPRKVAIIGGVAGGMSAATRLRRLDASAEITVFERSNYVSYANCGLPYFLGGVIDERDNLLLQTPESLHTRFELDVRVNHEITGIDRINKIIVGKNLVTGEEFSHQYDSLILSPGASAIKPPIPGIEKALTLRTVEDVDRLVGQVSKHPKHVTVIGAGFIGVETAENLRHRNIEVSLIEASPQVLAPLDIELGNLVAAEIRKHGVDLRLASAVTEIDDTSVTLKNGERIETELVILAIGVKPETSLATTAGIEIGPRGGIKVNEFQQTSDLSIYAIGDAAEKIDALDNSSTLIPLANIANRHGRVVADHICGHAVRPVDAIGSAIVKVFDLTVATTGWNERKLTAAGKNLQAIHTHPGSHAGYYPGAESMHLKLIFDPMTQEILGAQAVGKDGVDKRIDVIATAIRAEMLVSELADLELCYAPPFGSAKDPINMLGYIADNIINGGSKTVQWHQVSELQQAGYKVIDVRTVAEFENGHIPDAINIPGDELRARISEIPKTDLIINCQVGQRGHTATMLLNELGFDAANLDGGYVTWSDALQS
jgi:NADPH-dependent 2,4-dienoyl-CoA reductase/sulfur reductase-like enzyme/rhodanese-related sulfurtransferase